VSPKKPNFSTTAAHVFHRDGLVVIEDALDDVTLSGLRNVTQCILANIFQADPEGDFGGGAGKLPHRYSIGDSSPTRSSFHQPEFCALIDLPTVTPVLRAVFGSRDYQAAGCGGDVALAGAVEYQALHMDAIWGAHPGKVQDLEVPPVVTVNFVLEDISSLDGPMRVVLGSQRWRSPSPPLQREPDSMLLSTLCPLRAGSAIVRDNRLWHGGTPNLSDRFRALPNVEYFAPGGLPSLGWMDHPTMPFDEWQRLSPLAQHLARNVWRPAVPIFTALAAILQIQSCELCRFLRADGVSSDGWVR